MRARLLLLPALLALSACSTPGAPIQLGAFPATANPITSPSASPSLPTPSSPPTPTPSTTPTPTSPVSPSSTPPVSPTPTPSSSPTPTPSPTTSPTPSTSPPPSGAALQPLLTQMVLTKGNLPAGYTLSLAANGTNLKGATLQNCGFSFSTESHRTARRQEDIQPTDTTVRISNEVAAYDSDTQAALALTQWRTSIPYCVQHPSYTFQSSLITTSVQDSSPHATGLPVLDNATAYETLTVSNTATPTRKTVLQAVLIFQRQGRFLLGTYLESTKKPTAEQLSEISTLAQTAGKRMQNALSAQAT